MLRAIDGVLCQKCSGTEWENAEIGLKRCNCYFAKLKDQYKGEAQVPARYAGVSLANYKPQKGDGWKSQIAALQKAHAWVRGYKPGCSGLMLMGPCGVGKTHLAIAMMIALIQQKTIRCLFVDCRELLKMIQDSYSPASQTSELRVVEPYEKVPVLVLDEIGASKPTDWALDTLTRILNARYNDIRATILTTNYMDEAGPGEERLEDRIGVRLRSRLYDMCPVVPIGGEDYRKQSRGDQYRESSSQRAS